MIELKNVYKSFGDKNVLNGVNLTINKGETIVIIGKSGCGKSVMLKHIIGLMKPDKGEVIIEGRNIVNLSRKDVYTVRKKFGFLFQGAALFDSMSVEENVGLGLRENRRLKDKEISRIVAEKLELVGLPGIQNMSPSDLSGGMKKRVSLARAIADEPEYILYDEPTTGLDPVMSDNIDELIRDLADKLKVTSIIVTHDIFSVIEVAQRVVMMEGGVVYFSGTPKELFDSDDTMITEFLRRTNKTRNNN
ncbi:MAG TPA: ABC transporter ATP-binding protein [Ignavibacteria bacterium]|nr:ABC transporter ATP-binding protein [Ignavibacteria bacterium]